MSLRVSDEILVKNLLERHSLKDLFTILAKGLHHKDIKEAIVSLFDKGGFEVDEMVEICLDTKEGQKNSDEVTLDFIDEIFISVYHKKRSEFDSEHQFENKCYPGLWELKEKIEDHYLEDFLNTYDNDELIRYLEDTREFDDYLDNIKDDVRRDVVEEYEEYEEKASSSSNMLEDNSNMLEDKSPDELWIYLCNQAGCGHFDKKGLMDWMSDMFKYKLNKSIYAQMADMKMYVADEKKINCKAA